MDATEKFLADLKETNWSSYGSAIFLKTNELEFATSSAIKALKPL